MDGHTPPPDQGAIFPISVSPLYAPFFPLSSFLLEIINMKSSRNGVFELESLKSLSKGTKLISGVGVHSVLSEVDDKNVSLLVD